MIESSLNIIRTRPRFKIITNLNREEYETKLKDYLHKRAKDFSGNINKEVATISVKTGETPFWKPYLSIRTEIEDDKTAIRGVFGPSSSVWTFFMFLYFVFSILWMVTFTLWYVEQQIGSSHFPWALTASFILLVLLATAYISSKLGQKKAQKEMQMLRDFVIESTLPLENSTAQ